MANRAYRNLWGTDVDGSIASWGFSDEMTSGKSASAPSSVWMKLTDTLKRGGTDKPWQGTVWLDSHVELTCQYAPLPNGNRQIIFISSEHEADTSARFEPVEFRAS